MADGQTGSGKTFSIMGYEDEIGLIPRICETLFELIRVAGQEDQFQVEATYLEIYNEKISDLLNPKPEEEKEEVRRNPDRIRHPLTKD